MIENLESKVKMIFFISGILLLLGLTSQEQFLNNFEHIIIATLIITFLSIGFKASHHN